MRLSTLQPVDPDEATSGFEHPLCGIEKPFLVREMAYGLVEENGVEAVVRECTQGFVIGIPCDVEMYLVRHVGLFGELTGTAGEMLVVGHTDESVAGHCSEIDVALERGGAAEFGGFRAR